MAVYNREYFIVCTSGAWKGALPGWMPRAGPSFVAHGCDHKDRFVAERGGQCWDESDKVVVRSLKAVAKNDKKMWWVVGSVLVDGDVTCGHLGTRVQFSSTSFSP